MNQMRFIETPVFTRTLQGLLTDDAYRTLQVALVSRPDAGVLIAGGGGLRKLRWAGSGRGKRGGIRVIYYWAMAESVIYLLLAYPKNAQDDLTAQQRRVLRDLVAKEFA